MTSETPFVSTLFFSYTLTRMASGVKPGGIVQLRVGAVPLPESVTLTGKGTALAAAAAVNAGGMAVARSGPLLNVNVQEPFNGGVNVAGLAPKERNGSVG